MPRQRLRADRSPVRWLGRLPLVVLALALVWYGAMAFLLAVKVSPGTVEAISRYRTVYRALDGVGLDALDGLARLIIGLSGIATFLVCSFLISKTTARPRFARTSWELPEDGRGLTVVEPRAIERAVEGAALEHAAVEEAAGRYEGDRLVLDVALGRARVAAETLSDVQRRARAALVTHGLPLLPVEIRLTGFSRDRGRELA